ncbi:MAG: GAF domain-containing protein, partial [Candidatus Eisenbacteria bacterium]
MSAARAEQHPLAGWTAPDPERALALAGLLLEPVEENAILRRTVAALAAPGGFGFTRAFLFFADAERAMLAGRHAVGPADLGEARRLAVASGAAGDEDDLLATLRALDDDALESAAPTATSRLRGLTLPLVGGLDPVLDACLERGVGRFTAAGGADEEDASPVWGERLALAGFAAAIVRAGGRPVALLVVDRAFSGHGLDAGDEQRLARVAALAGTGIERARAARLMAERGGQLATLDEAGTSAVRATSLRSELALLVRAATQTLSCRGGVLWRTSGERSVLVLESVHVSDDRGDPLRQAESLEPLARAVLRDDAPRAVADAAADPALDPAAVRGFGAAFAVPVPGPSRVAGVLILWGPAPRALAEPGGFDRDDMRFAESLAGTLGAVLAQAALSERVRTAETRLAETKKQVATLERMAALGELAARAAQEVKHPLASIGGFARRVHRALAEDDPHREYLEIILRE